MPDSFSPGLAGVVAAETRLSRVDGEAGELWIGGFPVEVLAAAASFEEVLHLLWEDELPAAGQLAARRAGLISRRALSAATLALLKAAAARRVEPMDALRMAVASLDLEREAEPRHQAERLVASFPTVVAAYWRLLHGQAPVAPAAELDHAANYLYMLSGERPKASRARALETYLNTVIDHGLNASTFTARVIISTESDLVSAVTGAIGALKGPLHGGAPGPALDMVFEIGEAAAAEPFLRAKIARGERLMGFGHRVYRVRDPRAEVLAGAAEKLYRGSEEELLYELALEVERTAVRLLAELKPGRRLDTNVEYYTALLLHGVGLDSALFTPTFAVARVAGWTAHGFEQQASGRLIRPDARYVGAGPRSWQPLPERAAAAASR